MYLSDLSHGEIFALTRAIIALRHFGQTVLHLNIDSIVYTRRLRPDGLGLFLLEENLMLKANRMKTVVEKLTKKHSVNLAQSGAHLVLTMPHFDRLVVEAIDEHRVLVAHYFEQNGDLVPDPAATIFIDGAGEWIPIGIDMVLSGSRSYVKLTADAQAIELCRDPDGQADLAEFCATWAANIENQGWLERGEVQKDEVEPATKAAPKWPEPTTDEPDQDTIFDWLIMDGNCEATDGCQIEPDGICYHGHPSWLLKLGLI